MRIFLIGFMGCGKTTLGKKLAKNLNYNFIDLDTYIEKKTNKTITEIFENKGENSFRIIERESLMEVFKKDNIVISTGGGTPCFFNNMQEILVSGKAIYLKMKIKDLLERLETKKSQRPLIKNKSAKELESFIRNKLSERESFYKKSDYILQGKDICEKEIQNLIL
jgi:shikimate kinase